MHRPPAASWNGRGAALLRRPRRLLNAPGGAEDPRSFRPSVGARRGKEQYCRRRLGACKDPGLGDVRKRSQADRLGVIAAAGDPEVGHAFSKRDRPERRNRTSGLPPGRRKMIWRCERRTMALLASARDHPVAAREQPYAGRRPPLPDALVLLLQRFVRVRQFSDSLPRFR